MATPTRTSGESGSVDNADQLREQIDRCPSGALGYREDSRAGKQPESKGAVKAQVVKGGPLLVRGSLELESPDGEQTLEGSTAFCRCGASDNKPFCDGSHKDVEFDN